MTRLQAADWLRAAFEALAVEGLAGVRVEALARHLGVSKGSFYWHFADRAALLEALLTLWESESIEMIATSREAPNPRARMERLMDLIEAGVGQPGAAGDTAIFLWARQDPQIAARVAAVEARRQAYLEELLRDLGLPAEIAHQRAAFAVAAFNGFLEQRSRGVSTLLFSDFREIVTHLLVR